jgi:aspartate ammonia-lyase
MSELKRKFAWATKEFIEIDIDAKSQEFNGQIQIQRIWNQDFNFTISGRGFECYLEVTKEELEELRKCLDILLSS